MKQFNDRVAVVTGAAAGIGRELAIQLAERSCILVLADRDIDALEALRAELQSQGARCSIHGLDVADREAVEALASDIGRQHPAVHLLFNNAGVTLIDSIEQIDYEDFEWLMNINFWGVVYGTKAFLPLLRRADEAHIINVSSLFGLFSLPLQGAYNASKFAVRGFTESLKMELAGSSVAVSCVHPGGVKTDITRNSRLREGILGISRDQLASDFDAAAKTTAGDAARTILRGVRKGKRRILIGRDAHVADRVVRLFPGSYESFMGLERGVRERRRTESRTAMERGS